MSEAYDRRMRFTALPDGCVEVLDLGDGLSVRLGMPADTPADPDPVLVAVEVLRRAGVRVRPAELAVLLPDQVADCLRWASVRLLMRAVADGRLAGRPMPGCLARIRRD